MSAFNLIMSLNERGIDVRLASDGRLTIQPATLLTDDDRAAIREHAPVMKRLVNTDYTNYADGWHVDHDDFGTPSRTFMVSNGRIIDSCIFRTGEGARELMRRTDDAVGIFPEIGEKSGSFHRACAFEDALQALAACGWHGATAENVARAIADGVTDEVVLTAMLEVRHV